jgi:hypothetical protein
VFFSCAISNTAPANASKKPHIIVSLTNQKPLIDRFQVANEQKPNIFVHSAFKRKLKKFESGPGQRQLFAQAA